MACITFDIATFRALYPSFGQQFQYSDVVLQAYFDQATCIVTDNTTLSGMKLKQQTFALNLLTAHLLTLADMIKKGQTPGLATGSTVDKVSVTLEPPPAKTQFQWWLSLTAYGQELSALLQVLSVGGLYIGGRNELGAFRKSGGVF